MYSVLLVDDEPLITEGLSILINWKGFGFSEVITAIDGEEALAKIKSKKFHLIITDIKMPGLSGLNLIKALRIKNPLTKIVILSGYSDFSYAREAMQYGVKAYLLKPIIKDEITKVVINIKKDLDTESDNYIIATKKEKLIKDKLLLDMVCGIIPSFEVLNTPDYFALGFSSKYYCSCIFEVEDLNALMENNFEQFEILKFGVRNILWELFELNEIGYVYEDKDNLIGIILYSDSSKVLGKYIYDYINRALSYISDIFKTKARSYLGTTVNNIENLKVTRSQAFYAREHRFIFNDLLIVPYIKVVADNNNMETDLKWNNTLLLSSVEQMDISSIKLQISGLFEEFKAKKFSKNIISGIIYNNLYALEALVKKYNGECPDILNSTNISNLMNSYDEIKDLSVYLIESCIKVGTHLTEIGRLKSPHLIEEIKNYIDNNYYMDLSLKSISSIYYVNSAYLGRIFKNSTGESFNDYLNKIRISQIKKLYVNSNLKSNRIIEKVGYTNPEYFYKLFKKYEKISFTEYTENIKLAITKN